MERIELVFDLGPQLSPRQLASYISSIADLTDLALEWAYISQDDYIQDQTLQVIEVSGQFATEPIAYNKIPLFPEARNVGGERQAERVFVSNNSWVSEYESLEPLVITIESATYENPITLIILGAALVLKELRKLLKLLQTWEATKRIENAKASQQEYKASIIQAALQAIRENPDTILTKEMLTRLLSANLSSMGELASKVSP